MSLSRQNGRLIDKYDTVLQVHTMSCHEVDESHLEVKVKDLMDLFTKSLSLSFSLFPPFFFYKCISIKCYFLSLSLNQFLYFCHFYLFLLSLSVSLSLLFLLSLSYMPPLMFSIYIQILYTYV